LAEVKVLCPSPFPKTQDQNCHELTGQSVNSTAAPHVKKWKSQDIKIKMILLRNTGPLGYEAEY
jgi:hypothetical protein